MHIAQKTGKNNNAILLFSLLRYCRKCVIIYTTKDEKKPQQKASQRLQREPTNNGSVSQKGGKHSTTENGLTTQKP